MERDTMNVKMLLGILAVAITLTAGSFTPGHAASQTETAGYGGSSGCAMDEQPGHMKKCAMMMKRAMMMNMMKKVMTIQKKMLLDPTEKEKRAMIKELDTMIERLDKMMVKMHGMMKEKAGDSAGEQQRMKEPEKEDK